jgi:hypothetical protein
LFFDTKTAGYSYISYGAWRGQLTNQGLINSFRAGSLSPSTAVPITGTATYRGTSVGFYSCVSCDITDLIADVTLRVNYVSRTIDYEARSSGGSISVSGTLSYNVGSRDFSGDLTTPQGLGTGLLRGPASGSFYGPNAEEISGVFVLNWAGGTVGQQVVAFGAKRQ